MKDVPFRSLDLSISKSKDKIWKSQSGSEPFLDVEILSSDLTLGHERFPGYRTDFNHISVSTKKVLSRLGSEVETELVSVELK